MQILALLYRREINFPEAQIFESDCTTTKSSYKDIYRLSSTKNHVHHSHIVAEINWFLYGFCNWKTEKRLHVLHTVYLDSTFIFYIKEFDLVYAAQVFSIEGQNLISVNFASLGSQVKFVDTLNLVSKDSLLQFEKMPTRKKMQSDLRLENTRINFFILKQYGKTNEGTA